MATPLKMAVLVSGSGTTLQNLIDCISAGELCADIRLVIGSKPELPGLRRAQEAGVPTAMFDRRLFTSCESFSERVFRRCHDSGVDLICLGGWLCLLKIPDAYRDRVVNIHPALLPSFGGKGMFGRRVHEAVLAHGCKVSGCTVHFVDGTYDTGPIIVQRTCPVVEDDTPESLAHRVFEQEKIAYPEGIRLFHEQRLSVEGRKVGILPGRELRCDPKSEIRSTKSETNPNDERQK